MHQTALEIFHSKNLDVKSTKKSTNWIIKKKFFLRLFPSFNDFMISYKVYHIDFKDNSLKIFF